MTDTVLSKILADCTGSAYVFDSDVLCSRIKRIADAMPDGVSLCYAVKANTFIIKELIGKVDRFEICSPGEEKICYSLGVPKDQMVISGVYKTPEVIENTVADDSFDGRFTVESMHQFDLLCEYAVKYNREVKLLLRLTNDSQFGINAEEIENIISARADYKNIEICGIQFFSGTQKTSVKKLRREIEKADAFLTRLSDEYGYIAPEFEYGTGFAVSYFEGEEFDEDEYFAAFSEILSSMANKPHITLEIGRAAAASCGSYYTRVADVKTNKEQNYALTCGGMHQMVYFGQYMAMKQPHMHLALREARGDKKWNVCGSLCSMNDIIVKEAPLGELEIGDVICFENTGAYCPTEGISLFLSRDIPAVYIVKHGEVFRVRGTFETAVLNTPDYERI